MQPYQERVVEEKKELDIKIDKLVDFLKTLPTTSITIASEEAERLRKQATAMRVYSNILAERIVNFR